MDPSFNYKYIVDLSEEELIALRFIGDNAHPRIKSMVKQIRGDPARLGTVTCFMVDCLRREYNPDPEASPSSRLVDAPTSPSSRSWKPPPDFYTPVSPDLISQFERRSWYHGISGSPPPLLWRSDLSTNPFPVPKPTRPGYFFTIPRKTAHGVFGTRLNAVWHTVAPRILASIKARGLRYSALKAARFAIPYEDPQDVKKTERFGPVVLWIAVPPGSASAVQVRDATPDILQILADAQVTGVVVEWYEGTVQRLAGPPLMEPEDYTDPTFGLNHPFNAGLGIPIARQSDDVQGTVTLLFREVRGGDGESPSERVLALTTEHVASLDTSTDYSYESDGGEPQQILVCGERRFARAVQEIEDALTDGVDEAVRLAVQLLEHESKADGHGQKTTQHIQRMQTKLEYRNKDNATLQVFLDKINDEWRDPSNRVLGHVDWAPEISTSVDDGAYGYTRDIATVVVDPAKLENFRGNFVDLGNQYSWVDLEKRFWPSRPVAGHAALRMPLNFQLSIRSALPHDRLTNPHEIEGEHGVETLNNYIVGKYGHTTKLTFGHYGGMEAYICTESGHESREVVIYNKSLTSGDFATYGDSGALVFTGDGDGLAVLHSGMPRDGYSHVTFATPLWWVIRQVLEKYPSAEFYGMVHTDP